MQNYAKKKNNQLVPKGNEVDNYENDMPAGDEFELDDDNTEVMPINEEIIYPGLVLKKEYILLKKIGYGNNATVWLTYQLSTKFFLAIKIQDHRCYIDGCREVAILKNINTYMKDYPMYNIHCIKMLDFFVYEEDDDTKYVCSIYPLYAGNMYSILDRGKYKYGLPIPIVKKIAKQLLTALFVLHTKLKIIHTDIRTENILFEGALDDHLKIMKLFNDSGFDNKYNTLCQTYADKRFTEELELLALESVRDICSLRNNVNSNEELIPDEDSIIEGEDDDSYTSEDNGEDDDYDEDEQLGKVEVFNTRKQSIDDILEALDYTKMHNLEEEVDYNFTEVLNNRDNTTDGEPIIDDMYIQNCEIALIDFGNAYFYKSRTRNEIQDRKYRAPEIILDLNYGYSCDIWSFSCVVFELLTGFKLFEPELEPLNRDIHHLFLMEKMLGPIPLKMKMASKRKKFLFDCKRNYHIKNVKKFGQISIKQRLIEQFLFTEDEAKQICEFILCGLEYDPSKRISAEKMLNHPWLKY